jgi:hypothetical protein
VCRLRCSVHIEVCWLGCCACCSRIEPPPCKSQCFLNSSVYGTTLTGEFHGASCSKPPLSPLQILQTVEENQVTLIVGETGCGKTTQVPQYILESHWAVGKRCRIICSQPRRLSTISVAARIAAERGEDVGRSVGYKIRLESKGGPRTPLRFVTNGVLLKMLTTEQDMDSVSHLILDEIHERDKFADFSLILLRDVLRARPALRIVLMSATMQTELFSAYFGGCPVLSLPGFLYPVQEYYLEDILRLTVAHSDVRSIPEWEECPMSILCWVFFSQIVPKHRAPASAGSIPSFLTMGCRSALVRRGSAGATLHAASLRRALFGMQVVATPKDAGVPSAAAAAVHDAILAAFTENSDSAFSALLAELQPDPGSDAASKLDLQHPDTGATALMVASGRGRADFVELLLTLGAKASLMSKRGLTAAQWALKLGHDDVAELLNQHAEAEVQFNRLTQSAAALSDYQVANDADRVDVILIEDLIHYIVREGRFAAGSVWRASCVLKLF